MVVSIGEISKVVRRNFPDEVIRHTCLEVFVSSIDQADMYGAQKWGVYFTGEKIRLLVGSLIACTTPENALWMALDADMLNASDDKRRLLDSSNGWKWDLDDYPEYTRVPSLNGYYSPHRSSPDVKSLVEDLHFSFVRKAANKFEKLNKRSRAKHNPQVIDFLNQELDRFVPHPEYEDSQYPDDNPLSDLADFEVAGDSSRDTERRIVAESRLGQGTFRRHLIQFWSACAVTGCKEESLLKASHIKPWRDSNNVERLDPYNGLLLLPNLDSAFDRGLITFSDDGSIRISDQIDEEDKDILGIHDDMELSEVDRRHVKYLRYHREYVFKQG